MKTQITVEDFDYTYSGTEKHYNRYTFEYYDRHEITIYTTLKVNDIELSLVYQNAQSFINNDYSCPSTRLELSNEGGTSEIALKINELYESDFDNKEFINELIEEIDNKNINRENIRDIFQEIMDCNCYSTQFENEIEDELTIEYINCDDTI